MRRRPNPLTVLATGVCVCAALPLLYIVYHALQADPDLWRRLMSGQLPRLVRNTVALVATVSITTCVLGITAAWLVERTDLPGRSIWRWLLCLPLAIPGYVAAICYMFLLRRGGFIDQMAVGYLGFERQEFPLPPLFNLWGVTAVMSLYAFPFVFLAVAAALRVLDAALEDAARVAGRNHRQIFFALTLPLLVPAVAGGVLLVGLYVLSDFGTVALMRYQTFTTAIYRQFAGEIGRAAASVISLGLIGLSLPLLLGESLIHRNDRRYTRGAHWRPQRIIRLGRWRWLANAYIIGLATLALFVPLAVLSGLTIRSIVAPTEVDRIWSVGALSIWQSGWNSLLLSICAATLALGLALLPALFTVRYDSRYSRTLAYLSKTAFALPGIIVGLGFLMLFIRTPIYGTTVALGLALAFRLLPQAVTLNEATLRMVSPMLEQAARTMGHGPWSTLRRVTIPLAAPGLLAAWALAFVTAMKELPLLVILRPPGFDTLPVRVWEAANDSIYTQAAAPALLLIGLTTITLGFVYSVRRFGVDRVVGEHNQPLPNQPTQASLPTSSASTVLSPDR
ncbi:MAG: iron ABC transporter permease [Chloroflexales bacterium]|nr:iron ABC transporter permease [Chloroflexales bacterium]